MSNESPYGCRDCGTVLQERDAFQVDEGACGYVTCPSCGLTQVIDVRTGRTSRAAPAWVVFTFVGALLLLVGVLGLISFFGS